MAGQDRAWDPGLWPVAQDMRGQFAVGSQMSLGGVGLLARAGASVWVLLPWKA